MKIITIAAICIISTVLCKLFDGRSKEYGLYIRIIASAGVLAALIIYVSPVVETVNEIFLKIGAAEEYVYILFKSLGICYLTQFAFDICKDSGENALATQIEIAGKLCLILISLPLFESLLDIVTKLLNS